LLPLETAIPQVSVIVPVYNTAPYLTIALDSITSQSFREIEIIIVDDGSTDESLNIARRYAHEDARVIVLTQENKGQGAARNAGLEVARGEYVYFFDSDDILKPGALQRLYTTSQRNKLDLCLFSGSVVYDRPDYAVIRKNQEKYNLREGYYEGVYDGQTLYNLLIRNNDHCASAPLLFIRKDYLIKKNIVFVEDIIHEDESYVFEVIIRSARALVITDQLYIRRIRPGSTMTHLNIEKSIVGNRKTIELMEKITSTLEPPPQAQLLESIETWKTRLYNNITRLTGDQVRRQIPATTCPRLSVVVPCWGDSSDLEVTLSTLIGQTLAEIEIIGVDTKTDKVASQLLSEYAKTDHRIRTITLEEAGKRDAFEAGAAIASGVYLGFMEPGDFASLDCYEKLCHLATTHEADIVLSNSYLYTTHHEINYEHEMGCGYLETLHITIPPNLMERLILWEELPKPLLTTGLCRCGIFRRTLFAKHGQLPSAIHKEETGDTRAACWHELTGTVYCTQEAYIRHRLTFDQSPEAKPAC
jgi:glycosyltransferase involved in cell wall biosynthesis